MVIDTVNGDGAFLIGGGGNGGWAKIKEYIGYILDIAKMFAKFLFKRLTDLYDRIIDFLDFLDKCKTNIWQAIGMLLQVTFFFTIVITGLVLSLSGIGAIASTAILMLMGALITESIMQIRKKCKK